MIGRRGVLGLLTFGAVAGLSACGLVKSYKPFRYRLTVEVDTPQGLRTGSSVIEVEAGEVGTTLGGAGVQVRGEAVAVDLPGGQTLFALLRGDHEPYNFAGSVMFRVTQMPPREPSDSKKRFGRRVKAVRANRKLNIIPRMRPGYFADVDPPFSAYPMLVRFRDIADPTTVEWVDPDNLAAGFGDGVKLRQITVQLTEDDVTRDIEQRLSATFWRLWGSKHQDELNKGNIRNNPYFGSLRGRLSRNDFTTESST